MNLAAMLIATSLVMTIAISSLIGTAFSFSTSSHEHAPRVFVGTPPHKWRRLVSDCMTPRHKLQTLTPSSTVDEAMQLLLQAGVSGAPVVDDESGSFLVGVISSFDFLQQEAGDGVLLPVSGTFENVEKFVNAAKKICARRVGDIMSTNPVTLESSATMRSAAAIMAKDNLHRLLIVDNGNLMGIITTSDVMKDMMHVVRNLPFADEGSNTIQDEFTP